MAIFFTLLLPLMGWGRGTYESIPSVDGNADYDANAEYTKDLGAHYLEMGTYPGYRAECDEPDEYDWLSDCEDDGIGEPDCVDHGPCYDNPYHGRTIAFVEWDLQNQFQGSGVVHVYNTWIRYDGYASSSTVRYHIKDLPNPPSNRTAEEIFSDFDAGAYLIDEDTYVPVGLGQSTHTLNTVAGDRLEDTINAQGPNWLWAVGMTTTSSSVDVEVSTWVLFPNATGQLNRMESTESGTASPQPTLVVEYSSRPATPGTPVPYMVGETSITWRFTDNSAGYAEDLVTQLRDNNDNTVEVNAGAQAGSGAVDITSSTLLPNRPYDVYIYQSNDAGSAQSANISTYTHARQPAFDDYTGITIQQITAHWFANGNPSGTRFQSRYSADPTFAAGVSTAGPTADMTSHTTGILSKNNTYYFQVRAFNAADVPTGWYSLSSTMTLVDAVASGSVDGIHQTSVAFSWSDPNPGEDDSYFRVEMSTVASFTEVIYSSTVEHALLTSTVSNNPSSLQPNTTYYARIRALNAIHSPASPYNFQYAGKDRFATDPVPPDQGIFQGQATQSGFQVSWLENSAPDNPVSTTRYLVEAGTATNFTTVEHSILTGLGQQSTSFSTLNANTTYYARVRTRAHSGSANDSAALVIGSTVTKPVAAASPAISLVDITTITVTWSANGNGPTTLYVVEGDDGSGGAPEVTSSTYLTSATFGDAFGTTLDPNTTYTFTITPQVNHAPWGAVSSIQISTPTHAKIPAGAADPYSGTFDHDSINVSWDANSNPGLTDYYVQCASSAYADSGTQSSLVEDDVTHTFNGLLPNTTYYFRVAAVNHAGVQTDYYTIGSTVTHAAQPSLASWDTGISSITVTWSTSNNPGDTLYYATNSASGNFQTWSTATSWTDTGLSTNTAHTFRVKAINRLGVETSYAVMGTTRTRAAKPVPRTAGGSPDFVTANDKQSVAIDFTNHGSNPTTAPNRTQFAILCTGGAGHGGHYLNNTPVNGNVFLIDEGTTDPHWAELSDWSNGVVVASGLVTGTRYYFAIEARNGDQGAIDGVPNTGIPTGASVPDDAYTGSGDPVLTLQNSAVSAAQSAVTQVWINTLVAPFEADGSYHYHYGMDTIIDKDDAAFNTYPAWNGELGGASNVPPHNNHDYTGAVAGFEFASEGHHYLDIIGDEYLPPTIMSHTSKANGDPYHIWIDTTPPLSPPISATLTLLPGTTMLMSPNVTFTTMGGSLSVSWM